MPTYALGWRILAQGKMLMKNNCKKLLWDYPFNWSESGLTTNDICLVFYVLYHGRQSYTCAFRIGMMDIGGHVLSTWYQQKWIRWFVLVSSRSTEFYLNSFLPDILRWRCGRISRGGKLWGISLQNFDMFQRKTFGIPSPEGQSIQGLWNTIFSAFTFYGWLLPINLLGEL
jgi:hypothetical protein